MMRIATTSIPPNPPLTKGGTIRHAPITRVPPLWKRGGRGDSSGVARLLILVLALFTTPAQAAIVFTPHLSEYSILPPGPYAELTFIATEIEHIYDRNGDKIELGTPFVPAGDSTDAALGLFKYLWIGNIFRDTNVPILKDRSQFCRGIGVVGYQQNTGNIAARTRLFGIRPGANGLGDFFGLCGIYGKEHRIGPLKFNGLFATTVKFPIGDYDTKAALNIGTNYWTYIPQFAWHAELWGRLYIDGTFAYQFNDNNDEPSFGGLTPTRIANYRNFEMNFAWKFTEHWFADIGYSYRESVGSNHYDQLTVNFKDQPLSPQSACDNTNNGLGLEVISQELCDNPVSDQFFLNPRPGPYSDNGIRGRLLTMGVYYVYRTSSVLQMRVAKPVGGRGGQFTATYDVCLSQPCGPDNSASTVDTDLFAVQEAGAVSASPYLELRLVHLFWAP